MTTTNEIETSAFEWIADRPNDDNVHRLPSRAKTTVAEVSESETSARLRDNVPNGDVRSSSDLDLPRKRRSLKRPLLFALLPVALLLGSYFYVTGGAIMSTDNAYVEADVVGVSNDISGIVKEVVVHDNQKVKKGDVLFKLDDEPFRIALDKADAQLGMVKNDLLAMRTSYKDMQAQIAQAKADIALNSLTVDRQQKLVADNYTAQATVDAARNALIASQQKLASLNEQLAGIAVNLNGDPDAPVENHPRYKDALAARNEAARQLSHTVVKAPFDGIVTNVPTLQPGQYLASGATAFNIVSTDHVWIEASPKETELTSVEPGQKATVTVDTYPGEEWSGTVESISPASASSFSLLPAENTSGNWVKVVQRIPMRIRVNNQPGKPQLRVGMSVEVSVDTKHPRGLPTFLTDLFGSSGANRG
ncbi:MAG: HlyD family secretion protein [Proteobacteria bacterium]|nr:HlyD family secretion protein [Pseudomonadota bacterium]